MSDRNGNGNGKGGKEGGREMRPRGGSMEID